MNSVQLTLLGDRPVRQHRSGRPSVDRRWRTAVHEAGHAVFAISLHILFTTVTIRPSFGGILGHVNGDFTGYLDANNPALTLVEYRCRLANLTTILVAGPVAANVLASAPIWRGSNDYLTLEHLLPWKNSTELIDIAEKSVREGIESYPFMRSGIERLATALIDRITLDYGQTLEVITGTISTAQPSTTQYLAPLEVQR